MELRYGYHKTLIHWCIAEKGQGDWSLWYVCTIDLARIEPSHGNRGFEALEYGWFAKRLYILKVYIYFSLSI
jgi:hypothetical protein